MGWSIGYDGNWKRDIGYGVPAICDHPECSEQIDRGLAHVCGGEAFGGDYGCSLYFCSKHLAARLCARCNAGETPFDPKEDSQEWINWKLTDSSWNTWRIENPKEVERLKLLNTEVDRTSGSGRTQS